MQELESLLDIILHCESMILEGGGLQLPKIGGHKTNQGQLWKVGAVVWQLVATF